ncbi:hypothetical protein, partial [Paracoccus sp. S4493]|uniref:hypothetical protein n=1 Tax=Paracoccus sp. S4493 TaxID=579490 RepID=UPI0019518926
QLSFQKENSGACCFRFDIVDLPRDEDQQTAKTELTSVPSFQGATQSVRSRPFQEASRTRIGSDMQRFSVASQSQPNQTTLS